jgi:hypothetical protein
MYSAIQIAHFFIIYNENHDGLPKSLNVHKLQMAIAYANIFHNGFRGSPLVPATEFAKGCAWIDTTGSERVISVPYVPSVMEFFGSDIGELVEHVGDSDFIKDISDSDRDFLISIYDLYI